MFCVRFRFSWVSSSFQIPTSARSVGAPHRNHWRAYQCFGWHISFEKDNTKQKKCISTLSTECGVSPSECGTENERHACAHIQCINTKAKRYGCWRAEKTAWSTIDFGDEKLFSAFCFCFISTMAHQIPPLFDRFRRKTVTSSSTSSLHICTLQNTPGCMEFAWIALLTRQSKWVLFRKVKQKRQTSWNMYLVLVLCASVIFHMWCT